MRAYIDSNIFVFAVLDEGVRGSNARELFKEIARGEVEGVTSALTIDEIVWTLLGLKKDRELARTQGLRFLELMNLDVVPVSKEEVSAALHLMKKYPLRPRDAIHVTVALAQKCQVIVSDDADFDVVEEIKRKKIT